MVIAATESAASNCTYANHVNPQWVRLLNLLQLNVQYKRCSGTELHTADNRVILDFLSGYCVHNTGHNHPQSSTRSKPNWIVTAP